MIEFNQVELDHCLSCGGIWLDQGELDLILHGELKAETEHAFTFQRKGKRKCPHCGKRMMTGPLPGTTVEVDICSRHHGLWLDNGELQQIIQSMGDRTGTLMEHCNAIFRNPKTGGPV